MLEIQKRKVGVGGGGVDGNGGQVHFQQKHHKSYEICWSSRRIVMYDHFGWRPVFPSIRSGLGSVFFFSTKRNFIQLASGLEAILTITAQLGLDWPGREGPAVTLAALSPRSV